MNGGTYIDFYLDTIDQSADFFGQMFQKLSFCGSFPGLQDFRKEIGIK